MYRFVFALGSVLLLASVVTAGERTVVIAEDDAPFTVSEDVVVRLTGQGIAGATITAEVQGPAKLVAENVLRWVAKGHNRIGSGNKEFEVKPTGKGNVLVTITSTSPIPGQKPTVTKYQFDVE
jgi:hypothetical protein